jgi:hypothetical protein
VKVLSVRQGPWIHTSLTDLSVISFHKNSKLSILSLLFLCTPEESIDCGCFLTKEFMDYTPIDLRSSGKWCSLHVLLFLQ